MKSINQELRNWNYSPEGGCFGENPAPGKIVQVQFESGGFSPECISGHLYWGKTYGGHQITAYRIIEETNE